MKNKNVIDFFSKRSYPNIAKQNTNRNDELANKHGVYLGCLMEEDAKKIRSQLFNLHFKREQLDQLTREWDELFEEQLDFLRYCLHSLKFPQADDVCFNNNRIIVDKNSHVWIVYDYKKYDDL